MAALRHNNESYGPKTDEMAVFGSFFVDDSGEEGKCGLGKENQGQLARTAAETGRRDGKGREGMNEWEKRKRKRGRRGLEKRKTGIGKEEVGDWKRGRGRRATGSLQSETGRDNLLTVLLCYQQKGSRY
ncbi:MAG: hypothetical protein SOZ94_03625 [Prevotella sp.]|nr:hypothetical protein [Prevotella sp.]